MDKFLLSKTNVQLKNLTRTRGILGFLWHSHQKCFLGYPRCGLRNLSSITDDCSAAKRQRNCHHKDSAALRREIKAFRSLLRRSCIYDKQSFRQLHTGTRLCSSSSDSNEKEDKRENRNTEQDQDNSESWDPRIGIGAILAIGVLKILAEIGHALELDTITISWQDFVYDLLLKGKVKEVVVVSNNRGRKKKYQEKVILELHRGTAIHGKVPSWWQQVVLYFPHAGSFDRKMEELENELGVPEYERLKVHHIESQLSPISTASMVIDILFFIGSLILLRKFLVGMDSVSSPMGNIMKTIKPMKIDAKKGTSFKDVAGLKEAKTEILEYVDYLKSPQRFKDLGAKTPRGALLLGPPGCGKTLLAKALAAESDVPFFNMAGSEFVEVIGGLGAQRVRQLFKEARSKTPCIIYIDEVDAIGRKRDMGVTNEEEEQTLNQLLVEMDGMGTVEGVIIFAATNRADLLDKALLRPGRFDRQITIDPPTYIERVELFDLYLNKIKLNDPVSKFSSRLAQMTPGMTGADIKNVCNEAAINAARRKATFVSGHDLDMAIERVVAGVEKKTSTLSPVEKRIVAYHESGHALVGWLLQHTDALLKVTIVPRTSAVLGFAQYRPSDQKLYNKEELFERMCMALGGRASEALIFNSVTSGAQNDLKEVTKMAYNQIKCYGMNDALGHISFGPQTDEQQIGTKPYSKTLAALIDESTYGSDYISGKQHPKKEARKLVAQAYRHTEKVLTENRDKLQMLAKALLERETLSYADVENLIGPPPYGAKKTMDIYPHFEGHIPDNGENGTPTTESGAKNSESTDSDSKSKSENSK